MKSSMFSGATLVLIILTTFIFAAGMWYLQKAGFFEKDVQNIVLISIDTCRADYLSCYGYPRNTTPNIDKLSRQSIRFVNTYSPVPMTLPAHSSMLTGTIPPYHGVHDNLDNGLDSSNVTLSEILHGQGFTTCAIIGAFVLDSQFGLNQGFEYYNDRFEKPIDHAQISERRGDEISRFAVEWLEKHNDEQFFLFLHYYDPHIWYEPPEPFFSSYRDNPYAGEIAYTDNCIGQVIDKLKDLGLYESSLIIVTGDHGEMLGEHGEDDHMYFIYQSALKVPLIFKLPERDKAESIDAPVSIIDIVPTICEILHIETPSHVQGKGLSSFFERKQRFFQERYLYCESLLPTKYTANSLLGVVNGPWKYIQTTRPELYNLVQDPGETKNLINQEPHRVRILRDSLGRILEESVSKENSGSRANLDAEGRKRLESLGYLANVSVTEDFNFDQSKEDPKDLIDFHNMNAEVQRLIFSKNYDEAKTLCEQMLVERPQNVFSHLNLFGIAREQGDTKGIVRHLTEIVRIKPDDVEQRIELGNAFLKLGKTDEAMGQYREVLRIDPGHAKAYSNIGVILSKQGRLTEAISYFSKALKIDPSFADAYNNLNVTKERQRRIAEAGNHEKSVFTGESLFK